MKESMLAESDNDSYVRKALHKKPHLHKKYVVCTKSQRGRADARPAYLRGPGARPPRSRAGVLRAPPLAGGDALECALSRRTLSNQTTRMPIA